MSACLIALVVLAFLGIFSAKYRRWAKEAFSCVARRVTLRPCKTGFNEAVKAKITSKLMLRSPGLARVTHKHFELISWIFTIILFISLAYTAYGFYNLAIYGTCDPVSGNCVFNPGGDPNKVMCPFDEIETAQSVPTIGGFRKVSTAVIDGKPLVYFIGSTTCPHCRWEKPIFQKATGKFSGYIDVKVVELDITSTEEDRMVFIHFSPEGSIPALVLGGKYFRIGSGEALGEVAEEETLTAILCKITDNPIPECSEPAIQELVSQI
jgi:hypothetical protein